MSFLMLLSHAGTYGHEITGLSDLPRELIAAVCLHVCVNSHWFPVWSFITLVQLREEELISDDFLLPSFQLLRQYSTPREKRKTVRLGCTPWVKSSTAGLLHEREKQLQPYHEIMYVSPVWCGCGWGTAGLLLRTSTVTLTCRKSWGTHWCTPSTAKFALASICGLVLGPWKGITYM